VEDTDEDLVPVEDFVTVLKTSDQGVIAVAKSLLEGAGIRYYAGYTDPFDQRDALLGNAEGIDVPRADAENASRVLEGLPGSRPVQLEPTPVSRPTPWWITALVLLGILGILILLILFGNR
jgi:hypothetical protein